MISLAGNSFTNTEMDKHITVGKYSSIAAEVTFLNGTHLAEENHDCVFTTNWDQPGHPKGIHIGNDVWIGARSVILDGVTIGNGVIIGAGCVVAKDVEPYAVMIGNPMKVLRMRFTPQQIETLEKMKWWDWDSSLIDARKEDMKNVTTFLQKYA